MKTELNKKNNQTTVVIDVSYEVENNVARDFVRDEHATVFFNLKDKGIHRFEWYLNEEDKTGTLIEIFENSSLAGKNTSTLVAMQSMKAQAMAKVLVEEGVDN